MRNNDEAFTATDGNKVFDILGVGPGEKFIVCMPDNEPVDKDIDGQIFYISENDLYVINASTGEIELDLLYKLLTGKYAIRSTVDFLSFDQKELAAIFYAKQAGCRYIAVDKNGTAHAYQRKPERFDEWGSWAVPIATRNSSAPQNIRLDVPFTHLTYDDAPINAENLDIQLTFRGL